MKRTVILLALCVLALTGCTNSFKDIKITSCDVLSLTPLGLSSVEAYLELGVHNPAMQFTLTDLKGTVRMGDRPYLLVTCDDATVVKLGDDSYTLHLVGTLADGVNPFVIASVVSLKDFSLLKADLSGHVTLKNGLGKDIELKDLSLAEMVVKK